MLCMHWTYHMYPVCFNQEVCKHLSTGDLKGTALLASLAQAIGVYYNYTGQIKCFNISQQAVTSLGDEGWDFQVALQFFFMYMLYLCVLCCMYHCIGVLFSISMFSMLLKLLLLHRTY